VGINQIKMQQTITELSSIKDFIRFGVSLMESENVFYGHGTNNSYDEMIYLIYGYLNLPFEKVDFYLNTKLISSEKKEIIDLLTKRIYKNIPIAYLINKAYLNGFEFYVDHRAIIPRSFLANIILNNNLSTYIEHPELVENVLDLCTGNGSLAIIAAHYFYDADIIASDISNDALDVAQINIEKYNLKDNITLIKSDLFTNLIQYKNKFDLIITNPPYVETSIMNNLPKEYLHEPEISLIGGVTGIDIVIKIIEQARYYLNDFGVLLLEMGDNRYELEERYPNLKLKWFETENNDGFIFVVTKDALDEYFKNE
jgi:ribosomal protein L3 glutamine methyltransferase